MWSLLSVMLLTILVGIFWSEPEWKTRFLLSTSPDVSLAPIPVAPGTCSSPEMCAFEYWNVSTPFLQKPSIAGKTGLVVFTKKNGRWGGLSASAVGWAVLRVAALAILAVSARLVVGLAVKHVAFKKLFGSLWSTLDGWQGVEFQTHFVTSADYSQMDALLTSHLEILEALQVDIQSLVSPRRLARLSSAQHRLAASTAAAGDAAAPPTGSRVWWRALHVLVRELRLTIHELRLRLEQRMASTVQEAAASADVEDAAVSAAEVLEGASSPMRTPRLRRHVGRARTVALRRRPRNGAVLRAPRRARRLLSNAPAVKPRSETIVEARGREVMEPVAGTSSMRVESGATATAGVVLLEPSPQVKKAKTSWGPVEAVAQLDTQRPRRMLSARRREVARRVREDTELEDKKKRSEIVSLESADGFSQVCSGTVKKELKPSRVPRMEVRDEGGSTCDDEASREKEIAVDSAEMKENVPPLRLTRSVDGNRIPNGVRFMKVDDEMTPTRIIRNLKTPSIFLDTTPVMTKALLATGSKLSLQDVASETEACVETKS